MDTSYSGKVKVLSIDGKIWDVVTAELKPTGNPVSPFAGFLYPEEGAAITDWAGRVQLLKPDGNVLEAMISPGKVGKDHHQIEVKGVADASDS